MKKYLIILASMLFFVNSYSQEVLSPLSINPNLASKKKVVTKSNSGNLKLNYELGTFTLGSDGFRDDFSRNKLKQYDNSTLPDSLKSGNKLTFSANDVYVDSLAFSLDTTYIYFYDTVNNVKDSIENAPINLEIYYDVNNPGIASEIKEVWAGYYDFNFNTTTGEITDTVSFTSDSVIYQALNITLINDFSVDGEFLDSVIYLLDTTYTYTLNDTVWTQTPMPSFDIVKYNLDTLNAAPKTITVWPFTDTSFTIIDGKITDTIINFPEIDYQSITSFLSIPDENYSLWIDNYAFINNTYSENPITLGIATLDALNEDGYPYNFNNQSNLPSVCDYLTSKPINLKDAKDSVYLSFYYQPQGLSPDAPEKNDSLVVEFFSIEDNEWQWAWGVEGEKVKDFEMVMIHIKKTKYLVDGFQFRFKNYGPQVGTADPWHIDYVYLNDERGASDTAFNEVCFVKPASSILKDFYSMPYSHYVNTGESVLADNDSIIVRVIGSITTVNYKFDQTNIKTITEKSDNPSDDSDIFFKPSIKGEVDMSSTEDSAVFNFQHIISQSSGTLPGVVENDTLKHTQVLHNYYSYDDGTAEAAYGISGIRDAKMAYKFTVTEKDTITGISIFFNPILENASANNRFKVLIWNDNSGKPGSNPIIIDSLYQPNYTSGYNTFETYMFDTLIIREGTFWIGTMQTAADPLNIGMDLNHDESDKLYYRMDGTWYQTIYSGALMFRPVFGLSDIKTKSYLKSLETFDIEINPNPVKNNIYIKPKNDVNNTNDYIISIYNSVGTLVHTENSLKGNIDVSFLDSGFYIINATNTVSGVRASKKILISK